MRLYNLVYINLYLVILYFHNVSSSYKSKSSSVVIIKNYKNNLCLTYYKKTYKARLSTCKNNDLNQQWIIPKSGEGYYVSKMDTDICLNISNSGSVTTDLCSENGVKLGDIRHSKSKESIWSPLDNTKCLGILSSDIEILQNNDKRSNNSIRLYLNPCNSSKDDQHWRMEIIDDNFVENSKIGNNITTTKDANPNTTVNINNTSISKSYQCGPNFGMCPKNLCCSKYGWCGQTSEYCDNGCQEEYGNCNIQNPKSIFSTSTKKTIVKTTIKLTATPTTVTSYSTTTSVTTSPTTFTFTTTTATSTAAVAIDDSTDSTTNFKDISRNVNTTFVPEGFSESTSTIENPYRGWYHGSKSVDITNYSLYDCTYIRRLSSIHKDKSGLQYIGIQLEEFKNGEISEEGLNNIRSLFNEYREKAKSDEITRLIVRFYYDNNDNCKRNPDGTPRILNDIEEEIIEDVDIDELNDKSLYPTKRTDNEFLSLNKNDIIYVTDKLNYDLPLFKNTIINGEEVEENDEGMEDPSNIYMEEEEYDEAIMDNYDNDESIFFRQNEYLSINDFNEYNILSISDTKLQNYMNEQNFISSNTSFKLNNKFNKREDINFGNIESLFNVDSVKLVTKAINYNGNTGQCFTKTAIENCVLYSTEELEPDNIEIIKTHIKQLSEIVNEYKDIIYIHQGVFVGTWGEMHSSSYTVNNVDIPELMNTINDYFDPSIFLAVRTPRQYRMIMNYYNINNKKLLSSRLGLYNDGLFYNDKDYGTYGNGSINDNNGIVKARREEEISFQNNICLNVPSGGESVLNKNTINLNDTSIKNTDKNITNYNNFYTCNNYSETIHLSYLNEEYSKEIYRHWANYIYNNSTDFIWNGENGHDYIGNHLGYRYVIEDVIYDPKNYNLNINIKNIGYSPAYRKFNIKLLILDSNEKLIKEIDIIDDNRYWKKGNLYKLTTLLDFDHNSLTKLSNKYYIYFKLVDSQYNSAIKLGNDLSFTKEYGYKIGTLIIN